MVKKTGKKKAVKKKTSNCDLKGSKCRSKYMPIFSQAAKLKRGESLIVFRDKGQTPKQLLNSLSLAMIRHADQVRPRKGCKFVRRTTESGDVAICCVKA